MGETTNLGAKLVKISHIRKRETHFFNKTHISPLFSSLISFCFPLYATYLPPTCHLSPSEPHRNLIGISSEPHRNLAEWWAYFQAAITEVPSLSSAMFIIQRGPRKRSWRFGVLDECYSGILTSRHRFCFCQWSGKSPSWDFTPKKIAYPLRICDFFRTFATANSNRALQTYYKRRLLALVLVNRKLETFITPKQESDKCPLVCYIRCVHND